LLTEFTVELDKQYLHADPCWVPQ